MISTAASASAAHTQPDNPDDELVGATAAVDTGTDVVADAGGLAADVPAADLSAGDVSAVDTAAVGEPAADDAAGAGAPVNWNFTSPTTG